MTKRWLGVVVASDHIKLVDAQVPDAGPLVIQADHSWPLQDGDRATAYKVMHQRVADYSRENGIARAVMKASALSLGATKMAHLESCELRGVVLAALASVTQVECVSKAHITRTFGKRKVDEYVADDNFWADEITGAQLRKGSREAAIVLLARRGK